MALLQSANASEYACNGRFAISTMVWPLNMQDSTFVAIGAIFVFGYDIEVKASKLLKMLLRVGNSCRCSNHLQLARTRSSRSGRHRSFGCQ